MKKNLLLIAFLLIASMFFAGCGGSASSSSTTQNTPDKNVTKLHFVSDSRIYVPENEIDAFALKAVSDHNVTYAISGGDSAFFNVDTVTGAVTFKTAPDYETRKEYSFTASADDGLDTVRQNILIFIENVDETIPQFISTSEINVYENQLKAVNLRATDDQLLSYSLSGGDSSEFNVDATTGKVSFKSAPDYEVKNLYTFTAEASDGTNVAKQHVVIHIMDIDETVPQFVSSATVSVVDKQLSAITLKATDEHPLLYGLYGGDSLKFTINKSTGEVRFKNAPDYENKKLYTFTATANDGTNTATQSVSINILNIDESAPIFVSAKTVTVKENQFNAISLSATDNSSLSYSISGQDSESFNIDSTNGVVRFKTAPDYETKNIYRFTAAVTDGVHQVTQNITINIANIDETTPTFTSPASASVDENQLSAITLSATDSATSSDENNITYSISQADSAAFNVNPTTGVVTFKTAPDYETKNSYTFTAIASDGTNIASQSVTININDIDESAPIFVSTDTLSVEENQHSAITLKATDDNNITYSISQADSAAFNLNPITGVVTFKTAPDYETKNSYTFTAIASDGTNQTTQNVTISIIDIDETTPTFTSPATVSVEENQLNAVTLHANDDNTLTYSISGGDSAAFNLDSASGVVTFKIAPDYETKNLYTFKASVSDGTNTVTQDMTIHITDVNEVPLFTSAETASVKENQRSAITLHAKDDGSVTYSIKDADSTSFIIDSLSGVVRFKTDPDYETKNFYTFTGVASDGTNVVTQTITIDILDVEERDKRTGQTKSYDENGLEVTDGSISDDGYYERGVLPSYSNISSIVRDEITGLMWQDNAEAKTIQKPWLSETKYYDCENNTSSPACYDTSGDTAASYCAALDLGGYTDWRLPTQEELETIIDYSRSSPAIDTSSFSNASANVYWSSSTKKESPNAAWIVYFEDGKVYGVEKDTNYNVRCTREIKE